MLASGGIQVSCDPLTVERQLHMTGIIWAVGPHFFSLEFEPFSLFVYLLYFGTNIIILKPKILMANSNMDTVHTRRCWITLS